MNFGDPRLPERFWSKCIPEPNSGCWLWFGASVPFGYGQFYPNGHRGQVNSHRHAYLNLVGPIPDELVLDHVCRTPCCVNPAHMEPVTNAENVRRGHPFRAPKETCPAGHSYEINSRVAPTGGRICRACDRERKRRARG